MNNNEHYIHSVTAQMLEEHLFKNISYTLASSQNGNSSECRSVPGPVAVWAGTRLQKNIENTRKKNNKKQLDFDIGWASPDAFWTVLN